VVVVADQIDRCRRGRIDGLEDLDLGAGRYGTWLRRGKERVMAFVEGTNSSETINFLDGVTFGDDIIYGYVAYPLSPGTETARESSPLVKLCNSA
jgi:hypothetical protein